MMTRKDYVEVAEILNTYRHDMQLHIFNEMVADFCEYFYSDNPNFKEDKFREACANDK
jgi:hypothetical protein